MNMRGLSRFRRYTRMFRNPGRFFRREGRRTQNRLLRTILPRGAFRNIRMFQRLTGGGRGRRFQEPEEAVMFEGLEEAPEEEEEETGGAHRGAMPIYRRRIQLENVVHDEVDSGNRLVFQSNTIAIIKPPSPLMRLLQFLLMLLLLPLVLLRSLFGGGRPGGKGKMGRRLITVDRRGRVDVKRI